MLLMFFNFATAMTLRNFVKCIIKSVNHFYKLYHNTLCFSTKKSKSKDLLFKYKFGKNQPLTILAISSAKFSSFFSRPSPLA